MLKHTFLFDPGEWKAEGEFVAGDGTTTPVEGESRIIRTTHLWHIRSRLGPYTNDYEITVIDDDDSSLRWLSTNAVLGELAGTFTVVGDVIISIEARAMRGGTG